MQDTSRQIRHQPFPVTYLLVFLSLAAAVGGAGYFYYTLQRGNITQAHYRELSAIADLKVSQLRNWRAERLNDAEALIGSSIFAEYVEGYLEGPRSPARRENILQRLDALRKNNEYKRLVLVDRKGTAVLATGNAGLHPRKNAMDAAREAMRTKKILLMDLQRDKTDEGVSMDLIAPLIRSGTRGGRVVGAVIMRIDPERFLYPGIQAWPTQSPTGETLLVRREGGDVLYLNELRHKKGTALLFRIPAAAPDLPAAMVVRGQSGIIEGVDYRGTPVLAALRQVQGSPWFLVAKIDSDEVYAPVRERAVYIGVIVATLIVLAGTAVGFLWRRESVSFYRRLFESESLRLDEHREADRVLRESEDRLRKANTDLSRSNRELEQFAYIASHDLQEPLRMVASYLQLIERRYKGRLDSNADEFIGYAVDGAVRMQRMINDLLAYSRVGTKGNAFAPVDANEVLGQAMADLRLKIRETNAAITYDPLPTVQADASQLVQVFQNLLSNSIKFRGETKPAIHVSAQRNEDAWQFSVRDNGIGFDPAYAEKIFIIFQRLHPVSVYPGSGIGLTICKKIIERHGGRIWAESEPGKGALFKFTIPFLPPAD
jgi:signal transduction histidine kinase